MNNQINLPPISFIYIIPTMTTRKIFITLPQILCVMKIWWRAIVLIQKNSTGRWRKWRGGVQKLQQRISWDARKIASLEPFCSSKHKQHNYLCATDRHNSTTKGPRPWVFFARREKGERERRILSKKFHIPDIQQNRLIGSSWKTQKARRAPSYVQETESFQVTWWAGTGSVLQRATENRKSRAQKKCFSFFRELVGDFAQTPKNQKITQIPIVQRLKGALELGINAPITRSKPLNQNFLKFQS